MMIFTLGHISTKSPYGPQIDEPTWAAVSLIVAGCAQLAAMAYLSAVLVACRPERLARNLGQALLVQLGLVVPFAIVGVLATLAAFDTLPNSLNVMPSALETALLIRPELTLPVSLAMLGTFLLFWGIVRLVLFAFPLVPSKGVVSFVYTLVMHPLAFPLSWLVGLIHAVYVFRTVRAPHDG